MSVQLFQSDRARRGCLWLAAAVLILNLVDGLLTLAVVESGSAGEANPLMATTLAWGSVWFMAVKLALVSLGVALLWRLRRRRSAVVALATSATAYAVLLVIHVHSVRVIAAL